MAQQSRKTTGKSSSPYADYSSIYNDESRAGQATDKVTSVIDKKGGGENFFTNEANQVVQGFGGGAGIVEGVFTGDGGKIKEGIGNVAKSAGSALSAAPIRNALKGPSMQYAGGSKEALAANQAQYDAGILAGQGVTGAGANTALQGAGVAGTAADMGVDAYERSNALYGVGMDLGGSGIGSQNQALDASVAAAGRNVGSVAEQLQRAATDANGRQMLAQAASARGGNAAAAIRNAQDTAAQQALQGNQQIAVLRQQEAQDRQNRIVQAQQNAASQYGGQAQLGYGSAAQGLGAGNQAIGQVNQAGSTIGGVGGDIMQAGTTTTGQFLSAEVEQNKAQLAAAQANQEAKAKHKAGLLKGLSSGIASIYGGGG